MIGGDGALETTTPLAPLKSRYELGMAEVGSGSNPAGASAPGAYRRLPRHQCDTDP